ncbi:MAG: glycosyltransferase family 4 protein [Armatimonadota bacterium]|nr:glycosyltransferase family 4 protein [Armatimonadota bacterium]
MRIAQVAPLFESVPPRLYGGTERVVWSLTEALVRRGHDVTLFASGDSATSARLVPCCEQGLRLAGQITDAHAFTTIQLGMVYSRADEFDIIHNHIDYASFPMARLVQTPTLTTLHGRLDLPAMRRISQFFRDLPLVSVSRAQRTPLRTANWIATIYHGIPLEHYRLRPRPGQYLAFLGRISPEKRLDRAIEIARATDLPLKVAAKIDPADQDYYRHAIKPLLDHPLVEYAGEIDEREKDRFLGEAYAYLFPIDWPEPFGLTMIEAMATGTPVIAMACGSVPEIVEPGLTGFVCRSLDEMIAAVRRVPEIDRRVCRRRVEERFGAERMAADYEAVYERLREERWPPGIRPALEKVFA